jgi:hypothetical protein
VRANQEIGQRNPVVGSLALLFVDEARIEQNFKPFAGELIRLRATGLACGAGWFAT